MMQLTGWDRTEMGGSPAKRINEIDIVKALAVMLMVACHAGVVFAKFIYLFHMAIFFIASGFFFRDASSETPGSVLRFIINKFKKLWFPFFFWNAVFVLLHNPLSKIVILPGADAGQTTAYIPALYSTAEIFSMIGKGALFSYKEPLIGGFWFLKILFLVSICYCLVDFILKKLIRNKPQLRLIIQAGISVAFLIFGYNCSIRGIQLYGLAYLGSYYCLYFMGHLISKAKAYYAKWTWPIWLVIMTVSFGILYYMNPCGAIGYNLNEYTSPQYMVVCAFSGWCFLYSMAWFLNKIGPVSKILVLVGQKTLPILIFHLPALKLVQITEALIIGFPIYGLASFPNLQAGKTGWCLLYTAIGTGLPVILDTLFCKIIRQWQTGKQALAYNQKK